MKRIIVTVLVTSCVEFFLFMGYLSAGWRGVGAMFLYMAFLAAIGFSIHCVVSTIERWFKGNVGEMT